MRRMRRQVRWAPLAAAVVLAPALAAGAERMSAGRALAANVIVPQARAFRPDRGREAVQVTGADVRVVVLEQVATTTMEISLRNASRARQEAELVVPVPEGAVVRGFAFQGSKDEPCAEVLPKDEARRTYDAIVARIRDPALLEFVGCNLVRSSVFPVAPGDTQKVRLVYEHVLPADGARVDYVLPRSESLAYAVPWTVTLAIRSKRAISTVYSPSHALETRRARPESVSVRLAPEARTEPGSFRLSYLLEQGGVSASLLAYPDPAAGGGYFLLLAGLPAEIDESDGAGIRREVTLVLDRSGSMRGEKLDQVREAALQILAGLGEGEAFNLIAYNEAVDAFASGPVLKTEATEKRARAFLARLAPRGGTNIHDALLEALRARPREGMLPLVLFLTDGRPTVGRTSERAIRALAAEANPHGRRVFTLGVGLDVNTPLLQRIAVDTRAQATFILPEEDVELKVAQVFRRLYGPVLASPELAVASAEGDTALTRVAELMPAALPDLFDGDQLVLLGRYTGEEPLAFTLRGNYLGRERVFRFTFALEKATTRNAFVPRLWASRKIGVLCDAIRQLGADIDRDPSVLNDPRVKELVDEIVRLSTEFGILTEYTAFLAREGTRLDRRDAVVAEAWRNFESRAMRTRAGLGSVNQEDNNDFQMRQEVLNFRNRHYDRNMNRVEVGTVQQRNDRAFYRRGRRWIDSRLVERPAAVAPDRVVAFGSEEHMRLARDLAREGRQGSLAMRGEVLLEVRGETVLVK